METVAANTNDAAPPAHPLHDAPQGVGGASVQLLVQDVHRLALHAVETGQLPEGVDIGGVYRAKSKLERNEELTADEFDRIVQEFQLLEHHFPTITTRTLAATEPEQPGRISTSPTGRYLIKLWGGTGVIVAAIVATNLLQQLYADEALVHQAMVHLEPFLYGAFGAFAFILRVSEKRLWTREFDPARAPEHINRLVLGTLAGGAIILFFTDTPNNSTSLQIGTAALGFIAGYSVDFLFQTVERVIGALLPKVDSETTDGRSRQHRRDEELIQRYEAVARESDEENVARLMRNRLDDMRQRQEQDR